MKLKYYLRGMGIGIVLTTIIFMILIFMHSNDAKPVPDYDTESKTVAQYEDSTQKTAVSDATEEITSVDMEEKVNQEAPKQKDVSEPSKSKTEQREPQTKPEAAQETPQAKSETKQKTPQAESETKQEETVRFEISSGEFSDTVSQKLKDAGLVDDAAAFNRFLIEKDYDNAILPGVYEIPRDSTYDEIAALLTLRTSNP